MADFPTPNPSSNPGQPSSLSGDFGSGGGMHAAGNGSSPEMLHNVAQGAHQTIDRLTEQVTPHVQRLQENLADATDMLGERADQIRELTDEWTETLRCTVRENPLAAVGVALAIGLVVARLSR